MMKVLLIAMTFCASVSSSVAQTQAEMNQTAKANYLKADKALNTVYQKILAEYKSDAAFIKNFKASQRLWVQFRDAEMKAKYPDREPGYYGSVQPLCWYLFLQGLTEDRTKTLQVWLTGIEEGDSCAGSVKRKQ